MDELKEKYYLSRTSDLLALFDAHALAWKPFLASSYSDDLADLILKEAREQHQALISAIPYIGGDENPMTRHLVRSTTSLALYQAMKAHGKTARDAGQVIYAAVVASVSQLPPRPYTPPSPEFIAQEKELALKSQERCYSEDWVWEFVEGDGSQFDYGYDFLECGTLKLYHAYAADEFLPFYCYLDFVTHRTVGQGFVRTMTLAEGHGKCDFRWNSRIARPPAFCGTRDRGPIDARSPQPGRAGMPSARAQTVGRTPDTA